MKSRLLTTVFDDPEADAAKQFARDLRETLGLSEDQRKTCVDAFPEVKLTRTTTQERAVVGNLATKLEIPRSGLEHALNVINFFAEALLSDAIPNGDCDLWADDLDELGWIDHASRPAFEALLDQLTSASSDLQFQKRRRGAAGGVLPSFQSMGCTVEVRPIRKTIFRWGQDVAQYTPEILGTVMVASVHVGVDEGAVKDFYFQADDVAIDNIIDSLRAAKKEMAALGQFLNLGSTHKASKNE